MWLATLPRKVQIPKTILYSLPENKINMPQPAKTKSAPAPASSTGTEKVDLLNIGLMIIAAVLAIKLPFSVFLFAYAVLGPLHYLTEISWLRQRDYFLGKRKDFTWLIVFASLVSLQSILMEFPEFKNAPWVVENINGLVSTIIFCGFVFTIGLVFFSKTVHKLILLIVAIAVGMLIQQKFAYIFVFGVLFTTLIHVSLFTFTFIFQGAVRNKSVFGFVSMAVYLLCVAAILKMPINPKNYMISQYVFDSYLASNFQYLNLMIADVLHLHHPNSEYPLLSVGSIRIQAFIAFSYIYHYLNWFSKVNVVKWNQVPARTRTITVITWIVSVIIYAIDFRIGLLTLLTLSLAHVFLEFPLNIRSFQYLLKSIAGRGGNK